MIKKLRHSSESSCTSDYLTASSNLDSQRPFSFLDAPPGPFTALDVTESGFVFCFDERLNRIVRINYVNNKRETFTVSKRFGIEYFYWSHIVAINDFLLLALLKKHDNRSFYLASFSLSEQRQSANEISVINTKIECEGFQTTYQKCDSEVYFGFYNAVKKFKIVKRKSLSDMQLFKEHVDQKKSISSSPESYCDAQRDRQIINLDSDLESSLKREKKYVKKTGSTSIKVSCTSKGFIKFNILSIGKKHYGYRVGLSNTNEISWKKYSSYRLRHNYMTRLPQLETLKGPLYYNGLTYFINREDPDSGYLSETHLDPKQDVFSTVVAKLGSLGRNSSKNRNLQKVEIYCDGALLPPSSDGSIWSSFYVQANNNNCSGFVCTQDENCISLWKLIMTNNLDQEKDSNSRLFSDESNDTYDSLPPSTPASISPTSSVDSDYASGTSDKHNAGLKWVRLTQFDTASGFKLRENIALRISKDNVFIRGIRTNEGAKQPNYCIVKFQFTNSLFSSEQ